MRKIIIILILLIIPFQIISYQNELEDSKKEDILFRKNSPNPPNKKVIMIIVDSLNDSLIKSALEEENLPVFEFLMNNGQYYPNLIAPFPSMSVTIEASLMTGAMPNEHKIPGLSWYSENNNQLINYGSSFESIVKQGIPQTIKNSLNHLNQTHLNKNINTIYEDLDHLSFSSGAINTLVYRGNYAHYLSLPFGNIEVRGPQLLLLGKLTIPELIKGEQYSDSLFKKIGFNDQFSAETTKALIKKNAQPDFLLLYFPNMDKVAHQHGPDKNKKILHELKKVDKEIKKILLSYGSFKKALEKNIFIIIGDHGVTQLIDGTKKAVSVDLHQLYKQYNIASLSQTLTTDELAFGNNHRMAYIYPLKDAVLIPKLAEQALTDSRIDIIAYLDDKQKEWIHVITPSSSTAFRFKKGGPVKDNFDQSWTIKGDHKILSLTFTGKNKIEYTDYPDVLNQLYSALHSHERSKLILTAKPGYALYSEGIAIHNGGGEHGGLFKTDLLTSMIISGTENKPEYIRIIDLKQFVIDTLLQQKKQNE